MVNLKRYLYILAIIMVISGLSIFVGWKYFQWFEDDEDTVILERSVLTNMPFPEVDFVDSSDKSFQVENIKEGRILLVYLLDGCYACNMEVSIISNIQKRKDLDIKIWGVVHDESNNFEMV